MSRTGILCVALMVSALLGRDAGGAPLAQAEKTFSSETWGIALEYPAAWSVDFTADEVTFRADDGRSVILSRVAADTPAESASGRQNARRRCTTTTTAHEVVATVCTDAAAMTRRAVLALKTRDGRQSRLALRTQGREFQIFDGMVASARRFP